MELPPYRFPTLRGLFIHTWERTWQYIKKAGTVILGISILVWAAMTYPRTAARTGRPFQTERQQINAAQVAGEKKRGSGPAELAELHAAEAMEGLRSSLAGRIGLAFEPLSRYAGIDWRTNIALLSGVAAKEVILSTLGTAYSLARLTPRSRGR